MDETILRRAEQEISRFGDAEGVITLQPAENETGADAPLFHSLPAGKACTKHDAVSTPHRGTQDAWPALIITKLRKMGLADTPLGCGVRWPSAAAR